MTTTVAQIIDGEEQQPTTTPPIEMDITMSMTVEENGRSADVVQTTTTTLDLRDR